MVGVAAKAHVERVLAAVAGRVAHFDQRELDVVDRQRIARAVVEVLERGERELGAAPADRDPVAASRQRDVERLFDLPQVLVERAAEVGEARVVVARRDEFSAWVGFKVASGPVERQCVAALASSLTSTARRAANAGRRG